MSKKKGTDLTSLLNQGKKKFGTLQGGDDGFDWMAQRETLLKGVLKDSASEALEAPVSNAKQSPTVDTGKSKAEAIDSNATQVSHTVKPHKVQSKSPTEPNATQISHTVMAHNSMSPEAGSTSNATQNRHTNKPHKLIKALLDKDFSNDSDESDDFNATQVSHTVMAHNESAQSTEVPARRINKNSVQQSSTETNATQVSHTIITHTNATQFKDTAHSIATQQPHTNATRHTVLPHNQRPNATHIATQNTQLSHTLDIEDCPTIHHLSGQSLRLFSALVDFFLDKKIRSVSVSKKMLALLTGVNEGSVLTTTDRMKSKGFIFKEKIGKGKAAKLLISIPDEHFFEYIKSKNEINATQNSHTDWDTNLSSKLVSKNSSDSLTNDQQFYVGFDELDLSAVQSVGISQKQIADIRNQKLPITASQLQNFIDQFAIYVREPNNIKNVRNIRGLFVRMAQMLSRGEDPLAGIVTEEDLVLQDLIAEKELAHKRRQELQETLVELAFEEWVGNLTMADRDRLVPPNTVMRSGSEAQKRLLKSYFSSEVWQDKSRDSIDESRT